MHSSNLFKSSINPLENKAVQDDISPGSAARFSGIVFNLVFSLYAIGFQQLITAGFIDPLINNQAFPVLGLLIFCISMLEGIFIIVKIRSIFAMTERRLTSNEAFVWFSSPLVFRLITGLLLSLAAGRLISPNLTDHSPRTYFATAVTIILLMKEVITIFTVLTAIIRQRGKPISAIINYLSDFILLAYCCCVYTLLTFPGIFFNGGVSRRYLIPLIILCFFIALMSLRTAFSLQEYLLSESRMERICIWISLVIAALSSAYSFL